MPTWVNWSRTQRCEPAVTERPGSRAEVVAALERSAVAGRTVRVAGSGHSFTDAVLTDGTLLSLDRMGRLLDVDPESGLARVEAGITLHTLSRALHLHGLALPNLGDIDVQSLAGAIATATHGTGARLPNLSAQVEELELVLADGSERRLTAADGDLLRAARVGLGSLGVVVAATLRCVPSFRMRGIKNRESLEEVLSSLDERVDAAEHFEFWTFPHSPLAVTRLNARTEDERDAPGRAGAWLEDVLLENHGLSLFNRAARRFPRAIPVLNRTAGRLASRSERVDWSFRIFASPRMVRFVEMEYAVPREHAVQAVRGTRAILERYLVSFPLELRFVAADDALLSPASGRDTAYVAVHVFEGMAWEAPFGEFEAFMSRLGGRPHWGKLSFLTARELAPRYPGWDAFQAARRELDPGGRFTNAWARRVLG
jgi:L-gulono-1,4-lactone dehydrogenase